MGAPDLIVEVLSPSTAKRDRGYKMNLYADCGIKEYWIVDINNRAIEVYLLYQNVYILDNIYALYPDYLLNSTSDGEALQSTFTSHLFGDMVIDLNEVFNGLMVEV